VSAHPLIVILGPTGSGKTALSLALADSFPAEIVSCDSIAVYREFEIGTAKPSRTDRARIPHHMIDVYSPEQEMTAGEYSRQARAALADIKRRQKIPIVVGGTGLYLRALLEGLFSGPQRSEPVRERLRHISESRGSDYLHRILSRIDRAAAARIHANDVPKVIRAVEVTLAARKPISRQFTQGRDPLIGFNVITIGLDPDRTALYEKINRRCEEMFAHGLVEETRTLLTRYPSLLSRPNSPLNALGYKQAIAHIRGELSIEESIAAAAQSHRNYAKRQLTWFHNQHKDVTWFNKFGEDVIGVVMGKLQTLLAHSEIRVRQH
jgi:tRNA dimethylallyltransferase